jgi:hypothetical protein
LYASVGETSLYTPFRCALPSRGFALESLLAKNNADENHTTWPTVRELRSRLRRNPANSFPGTYYTKTGPRNAQSRRIVSAALSKRERTLARCTALQMPAFVLRWKRHVSLALLGQPAHGVDGLDERDGGFCSGSRYEGLREETADAETQVPGALGLGSVISPCTHLGMLLLESHAPKQVSDNRQAEAAEYEKETDQRPCQVGQECSEMEDRVGQRVGANRQCPRRPLSPLNRTRQ